MSFNIILTPFWSAYTDAYVKKDFTWITETFNKTKKIWIGFSIAGAIIFISSPIIYAVWLHGSVTVPVFVSFAMLLYTIGYNWMSVSCYLLNGLGKIRLQLYLYIFSIFFNIPLAIFFGKLIGIAGVSLSNVVIFIIMGSVLWIQCEKISKGTAVGIWNK
jgi:O-antigen/teichoic acid export membrane protein